MIRKKQVLSFLSLLALLVPLVFSAAGPATPRAQAQTTNVLTINVVSARTEPRALGGVGVTQGDPIANYKYIINVDNTGTTTQRLDPVTGDLPFECTPADPAYPANCDWVSIAGAASHSPIYTQGDQSDFGPGIDLPDGRYLISVLADGYKLDGAHFTVPLAGPVTVELQPTPLPAGTVQAEVFEDISPVNGAPDVPLEHGLAGFTGKLADYLGMLTTDVFGNPLCSEYERDGAGNIILDADNNPTVIPGTGGVCVSKCYVVNGGIDLGWVDPLDAAGRCPDTSGVTAAHPFPWVGTIADGLLVEGKIIIPNLGPNRYALTVIAPDGTPWVQTTTLEGNHDWDAWVMEGDTGLDTEFVVAGEPFPGIIFGFVYPGDPLPAGPSGEIKGLIAAVKAYVPLTGGLSLPNTGFAGQKIDKPIDSPWVTLSDLNNGDTAIYIGQGNPDGTFDIQNVPDGSYSLAWWDQPQDYILDLMNVTVANGEVSDLGVLPLMGWWTEIDGYVFEDINRNGVMDPGEKGLPNFAITMRKRENSLMDRGATLVTTDASGYYYMENAYPMTQWLVEEAYHDLYYTTGVTYQADNQPEPTTVLGAGVDVSVLPIIGLSGRLDWGVHAYDASGANGVDPQNGGIVGTVSYDTTRNELDPRYAVAEDWQPGISDVTVNLYDTVACGTTGAPCDDSGRYELAPDGSFAKGQLLNAYLTETWERPTGCVARNVDGVPFVHGVDENVLPLDPNAECLEGPLMSVQFQNGYSNVDGNYGFGDGCFNGTLDATDPANPVCVGGTFETLPGGRDYLVEVEIPNDALGRPLYKVTREEDINIGEGDQFTPQVPPPACVGPLHIVDVAGIGTDGYPATTVNGINVPASTPTVNPTFVDIGGSPYEGTVKPLCNMKLVQLNNGKSVAPLFHYFTDVPIPGRFWGLIVDDLNFSSDPRSLLYGEKAGVPFAPVGIYDYTNRLVATVESDFNGLFDVLLPSSNRISCPTPSGVCANLYRFVGNDPGTPGQLNPNYNPNFRTIAAPFEAIPGLLVPADLAPTQVGVTIQLPGGQVNAASICALDPANPQIFRVARPYVNAAGAASERRLTITGLGFGATQGIGHVDLDGVPLTAMVSWTDTQIEVNVPTTATGGPHQLSITNASGLKTVNGLSIHVIRATGPQAQRYNPNLYEVGPGLAGPNQFDPTAYPYPIQAALDAAAASPGDDLVVVYPGTPDLTNPRYNPRGAYYENPIIYSPVKLQGVGPGGVYADGTIVPGSIIDGGAFGGDTQLATDWRTKIGTLTWVGNQTIYEAEPVLVLAQTESQYTAAFRASIDGFDIRGGDQMGFPANINEIGGGPTGNPPNVINQGGAIYVNAYAHYLQITNNVIENNGGAYGTVRIGTPNLPAPNTSQHNDHVRIAFNRVIANAGTNLAGGIGLFAGSDSYEVAYNDVCGNFSAEYGGGISHFGLSPNSSIHHNRVYFNRSYDEGGGILIAGELPADPSVLSPGAGALSIYANVIQANLGNDDGGGIRFLMAGNYPMSVYNNMIVNNVSTHEGGGISLNDTPDVRVYNNTIMKNITTATAATSNGTPAPAGLSTSANSGPLQATLPAGAPAFSNPLLFNNIFWDNRAGTRALGGVVGIGATGDTTPIDYWDLGVADYPGQLAPSNSIVQQDPALHPFAGGPGNMNADPLVVAQYDLTVEFNAWRTNPNFVGAILVAVNLPTQLTSDYHLQAGSPANNAGAGTKTVGAVTVLAPNVDIDGDGRPSDGGYEIGADELPGVVAIQSRGGFDLYLPIVAK